MADHGSGFRGRAAAEIVGITYRQLDYWARTDLVRPSLVEATGSGSVRRYAHSDLAVLRLIKVLLDEGMPLERIRTVMDLLRGIDETMLRSVRVVIARNVAVVVRSREDLLAVIDEHRGRGVLNLIALDGVIDQVDSAIAAHDADG